jgi:hypothetical protein
VKHGSRIDDPDLHESLVYKAQRASLQFTILHDQETNEPMPTPLHEQLIVRLSEHGERDAAVALVDELIRVTARPDVLSAVLVLLDELQEVSSKASAYAHEASADR